MPPRLGFQRFELRCEEAFPGRLNFTELELAPAGTQALIHNRSTYLKLRGVEEKTREKVMKKIVDAFKSHGRGAVFLRTTLEGQTTPKQYHNLPSLENECVGQISNPSERKLFLEAIGAMQFLHAWGNKDLGLHVFKELGLLNQPDELKRIREIVAKGGR